MSESPADLAQLPPPEGLPMGLWAALIADLANGSHSFVQSVTDDLHEASLSGADLSHWPATLTTLRQHLLPHITDLETMVRLEDRLHRAERLAVEVIRQLSRARTDLGTGAALGNDQRATTRSAALDGAYGLAVRSDAEKLQQVVRRLHHAPDAESALRIALEELSTVLGASIAVARLGTSEQLRGMEDGEQTKDAQARG